MATITAPRTVSRASIYGPLFTDSVLDDLDAEAAVLGDAFAIARHRAIHAHDRWNGDVSEIHAHLTAHPAF